MGGLAQVVATSISLTMKNRRLLGVASASALMVVGVRGATAASIPRVAPIAQGAPSLSPASPNTAPASSASSTAPPEDLTPSWEKDFGDRTLRGNTFLFPPHFDSAFIATYIGGRAEVRIVRVSDVSTQFGVFDLDVAGAGETIDLGIKLGDVVGLRLSGAGAAIVGSNIPAVAYNGATYSFGGGVRVPVRLFRIESSGSQLALVPYFGYAAGKVAALLPLFQNQPSLTLGTLLRGNGSELLFTPIKTTTFGLNAAFAQAFNRNFAVQAEAGLGRSVATLDRFDPSSQDRNGDSTGAWAYNFGVAFTADAGPCGFPLAGLAEWSVSRQPGTASLVSSSTGTSAHTIALGAYYTGRRDLQLGVVAALELGLPPIATDVGESDRPNSKDLRFELRYFW